MLKRILVALDGSEHGLAAVRTGAELARKFDADLHLLTVTRPYRVSPDLKRFLQAENLLGEPKYVLDEMTSKIMDEAKDVIEDAHLLRVTTAVREGKPARSILAYAKHNHIDLIVTGSRGVGDIEGHLLGSVSQKVSLLAECNILIVRS